MKRKKGYQRILVFIAVMTALWCGCSAVSSAAKKPSKPAQVKNVKITPSSTRHKVSWKKVSNASGYQVYCRDYSSTSKKYKKIKTLKGASSVSCTITGRKVGKAYGYIVRAYRKNRAGVSYGKLSSIAYGYSPKPSTKKPSSASGSTNTAGGSNGSLIQNPTEKQKYQKVFGNASLKMRYPGGYYKNSSTAKANMVDVTVKTWDFKNGKSGEKYTRTWTIKVHKNLAATVKQIFNEIYNGKEKFPIHELGGYDWRGGHSEHNTGTAIDINWTENYMVNVATGAITAGKYWRPGKDPYSIPKDGEVARIFRKYGFSQGDWGNSKDYMHFSYFGT